MPEDKIEDPNALEDFDMDAAVTSLKDDLFGQGDSGGDSEDSGGEGQENKEPTLGDPAPQTLVGTEGADTLPAGSENSAAVEALGAPKTWTKEAIEKWATVDPIIQKEVLKREEDMFRGIEEYKGKAELGSRYDSVVEPFKPMLAAEQIDPVGLFQSFASNHYLLSRGTPEQKTQIAANLVRSYGLDLNAVHALLSGQQYQAPSPEFQQIRTELTQLRTEQQQRQQSEYQANQTRIMSEVEAFSKDPSHPHYSTVVNDMTALIKGGVASNLQQAYEMAVYNNPVTRQLEIDRLTSEKMSAAQTAEQERIKAAAKAKGANVNTSAKTRDGTVPIGSMEDTLNETFENIKSRMN